MSLQSIAKAFGCHDVVLLNEPMPRHLDYLDLLKASGSGKLTVDAVAEFQARPLLYLVSEDRAKTLDNDNLIELQHILANRGERAYLGVLTPGELNVYPVNLDRSVLKRGHRKTISQESSEAPLFFQSIVNDLFELDGQPKAPDYVFDEIHDLIQRSSEELIGIYDLNPLDVLSFLGRALFFRFLWDRRIIRPDELDTICPLAKSHGDCFSNVANCVATSRWLDDTFNGDLLPLSSSFEEVFAYANGRTKGKLFDHLRAIIEGWEHVGKGQMQLRLDWGDLDFAHIPIGVLSQVYESFSRVWDAQCSENTSVYYTPKNIARYLVDDAIAGVANKQDAHILDPSCGAGIFLVLAFRKLVAARWAHDGKRPNTKIIQDILYKQLCGFDISESALRLAALSLYITAIELNDSPRPPKRLKFPKPLQGVVLHNQRKSEEHDSKGFVLGSLRPDLPEEFNGRFDLVIGNPPWSRLRGNDEESKKESKAHGEKFTALTRRILRNRGLTDIAETYSNPDNNPDLPFLWKSTQWAKPGGIIAMALHGRIFLKPTQAGISAFNAILRGIAITGILNGSNLSDTKVWPHMNQPFMLFFARNNVPSAEHYFHFVTPHYEKRLNEKGRLRIDYQSAQPIAVSEVMRNSYLLKTLACGTSLDVELLKIINESCWPTVKQYWNRLGYYTSRGYDLSPNQKQYNADFLYKLPLFIPPNSFCVDTKLLTKKFDRLTAHMPRCKELYTPPVLIMPESPGDSSDSPKSWVLREPIAFRSSYYGFSAFGCVQAEGALAFLHLITHSDLFRFFVLMTSSKMGAERRTLQKITIETFPFPEINQLAERQRRRAVELSTLLETAPDKPWQEINDFIFDLYGLDAYDRQVVKDTLEVAPPYKEARERANNPPTSGERKAYYSELQRLLAPSFAVTNETVTVDEVVAERSDFLTPWYFFAISDSDSSPALSHAMRNRLITQITQSATETGCSRTIVHEEGMLLVGVIGQYRYWTLSRARLCALDILRHHLDVFPIGRS
jgi:hypothetical protein